MLPTGFDTPPQKNYFTGTATHDGTAIAQAVVQHLKNKIQCRTMFVTHFKSIIGDINAHMGFLSEEEVLFLYKVNKYFKYMYIPFFREID